METETVEPYVDAETASKQLRKLLGLEIAPSTLGDRGRRGTLPSCRLNGRRLFRMSELVAAFRKEEQAQLARAAAAKQ